jgi:uncharacterized protein YukE
MCFLNAEIVLQLERLRNIVRNFQDQLQIIQDEWNRQNPQNQMEAVAAWRSYMPELFRTISDHARTWSLR